MVAPKSMIQYWVRWQQCVWVPSAECWAWSAVWPTIYACMCVLCVPCVMCMWRTWLMFASARLRLRRLFLCRQFRQATNQATNQPTTETTSTMKMLLIFLRFQSSQVDLHHCSSFHGCTARHESPPRYLSPLWSSRPSSSFRSAVSVCLATALTLTVTMR